MARPRRLRLLVWTCFAAALPALTLGLAYAAAGGALRLERRAWIRDDPGGAAALDRLRPAGADETARRLIAAARPIGIELALLRSSETDLRPTVAFVDGERHAAADGGSGVPPAIADELRRLAPALDAIEDLLVRSGPPVWRFALRLDAHDAPTLGLRDLNALLLARALQRDRSGDRDGTGRSLLASARLGESVRDRPEQLAQATAAWMTAARAGVLRRLAAPPPGWRERLGTHDFRASMLVSYQLEARQEIIYYRGTRFSWRELTASRDAGAAAGLPPAVDRLLTTPYARWCAADRARRLRGLAATLRATEPCRLDPTAVDPSADLPRWNFLARITLPVATVRWSHVADVELDEELTGVVLDSRARPPVAADAVPSRVCGGLAWNRTPDGSGGVAIETSGVVLRPRSGRSPWRYHVQPAPVVASPSPSR
ncbi:MAG: hypothetical protein ABW221_26350 [Vicinamibacteria bacterium]